MMTTRERLIEAAADLFYSRGIHRTGIDLVVERSGFSKPTLYKHFRSKNELVVAVLELRNRNRRAALEALREGREGRPRAVLDAVIAYFVTWYESQDYRACALVNAAVELPDPSHPGRRVIQRHKAWMTDFLEDLAREAGLMAPRRLARALVLLEEGATVMAYIDAGGAVGPTLKESAAILIAAHEP